MSRRRFWRDADQPRRLLAVAPWTQVDVMSDIIERLNAALEGRYHIEREIGEGGMLHRSRNFGFGSTSSRPAAAGQAGWRAVGRNQPAAHPAEQLRRLLPAATGRHCARSHAVSLRAIVEKGWLTLALYSDPEVIWQHPLCADAFFC